MYVCYVLYACVCVCMYVYMYVCMYVCMYACMYMYVYMYVHTYVCIYMYIMYNVVCCSLWHCKIRSVTLSRAEISTSM